MHFAHTLARRTMYAIACLLLIGCSAPTPSIPPSITPRPSPRPTFSFPTGTPVPITSAEGVLIEHESGPLYVILSTIDDHGLPGEPTLQLMSQPDPADAESLGAVTTGSFAQVLEVRRLPPDSLRSFYRVRVDQSGSQLEGWVSDWNVHRTVFVVAFDAQGCACPFDAPLWADEGLTRPGGQVANRSPLRLLAVSERAVQIQVLVNGMIGWLARDMVHESEQKEFVRGLTPEPP